MPRVLRRPAVLLCLFCLGLLLAPVVAPPQVSAQMPAADAVGRWSPAANWPVVPIHLHLLPNGKVLAWSRDKDAQGQDTQGASLAFIWNPATDTFDQTLNTTTNLFCSGHAFLPDGRLLVTGGHKTDYDGPTDTNVFDFRTNSWARVGYMNNGRWYPANCTLGNGEVLVLAGTYFPPGTTTPTDNNVPQVWQLDGGWRGLSATPPALSYYPWVYAAPNGKAFVTDWNSTTGYLDTTSSAWTALPGSNIYDPDLQLTIADHSYGSSVMYEPGRVLILGGGPPTRTAAAIDLTAAAPSWVAVAPMATPRKFVTATLLPDGSVLATGGTTTPGQSNAKGAVYTAELWNPAGGTQIPGTQLRTGTWTTMASMQVPRLYHSAAILLPDGRVLSGGTGLPASARDYPTHMNAELYSPPYLFKGARPVITNAPAAATYGQTFFVATPDAAVSKVTLVRLSSVTHSANANQRFNSLGFTPVAGGLNVTAPPDGNVCPPGDYMLFILNGNGVPSVAKIINVGVISAGPNPCTLTAGQSQCTAGVSWNTQNTTQVKVWVSANGGAEVNFATSGAGLHTQAAPWIQGNAAYTFTLYDYSSGTRGATLGRVVVKGSGATGTISAAPNPCTINAGQGQCATTIGWDAQNATQVQVWVSDSNSQQETQFATAGAGAGAQAAPWIQPNAAYTFTLYDYSSGSRGDVLGRAVVRGTAATGTISADPHPCPVAPGQTLCASIIKWNAQNTSQVKVWVATNGDFEHESLFAASGPGLYAAPAPWLQAAPTTYYTFSLYDYSSGSRGALLGRTVAGGTTDGFTVFSVYADPNPCTIAAGQGQCGVNVAWNEPNPNDPVTQVQVWVSTNGGGETLFAASGAGAHSQFAPWIQANNYYTFTLYDYSSGGRGANLGRVVVTAR